MFLETSMALELFLKKVLLILSVILMLTFLLFKKPNVAKDKLTLTFLVTPKFTRMHSVLDILALLYLLSRSHFRLCATSLAMLRKMAMRMWKNLTARAEFWPLSMINFGLCVAILQMHKTSLLVLSHV